MPDKNPSLWSQEDISLLKENYNKLTNDELLLLFPQRTFMSIYKKAYKLGLRKDEAITFKNRSSPRTGEKAHNWNGGTYKSRKGYRLVLCKGHHRADKRGYVMEHVLVWEKTTGLEVPDNCCVHHLNGIKDDNRPENLCLMEHGAHTTFHRTGKPLSSQTRSKISKARRRRNAQ